MPMPGWWRHLNKNIFNPRVLKSDHNWTLITHYGRHSGTEYKTPVEAFPVSGGFVTYLMYGRNTDWVKNLLATNSGSIEKAGNVYQIVSARIVSVDDVAAELDESLWKPAPLLRVREMIRMDVVQEPYNLSEVRDDISQPTSAAS